MARSVVQAFEKYLEDLTPTATQRTNAASHRAAVKGALESGFKVNNFFETGSFTHGTGVRSRSDVDCLVSVGLNQPGTSDTALSWVKTALTARFPTTNIRVSRPAVVIEFAGGKETWEVIPGFAKREISTGSYLYDIPGPSSGWIESAPKAHLTYVNSVNDAKGLSGGAKKLARLMKAWKYERNVPISSFYLEMRAAKYMESQKSWSAVHDLSFLLSDLHSHQLASMNDPSGATGRFAPCSSDANRVSALSKLSTAATRASNALDAYTAGNEVNAFYYLDLLFDGAFPAR